MRARAFSLTELLVVMAITTLLIAAFYSGFRGVAARRLEAQAQSFGGQVAGTIQRVASASGGALTYGQILAVMPSATLSVPTYGTLTGRNCAMGVDFSLLGVPESIPQAPQSVNCLAVLRAGTIDTGVVTQVYEYVDVYTWVTGSARAYLNGNR